jgi:tRNA 2-thiocytidine biosynthesis protein TtcA
MGAFAVMPPAQREIPAPDPDRLAYFILKRVNQAIREFDMIRSGDRIAVAVSGGKDSLALLRLLQVARRTAAVPYELAAVHVRGDAGGITAPHLPLEEWLAAQGVPWHVVEPDISTGETVPLSCHRCTWLRRKALFHAAEELDCNAVAFAHHADDAAQTTLLSLLYGGAARTLAPSADYFGGHFHVIRPLLYVPEKELVRLARASDFPSPPPVCPRGGDTRRRLVGQMLGMLGRDYPHQARPNLIRAGLRGLDRPNDGSNSHA